MIRFWNDYVSRRTNYCDVSWGVQDKVCVCVSHPVDVGMDQSYIVVAGDDITESRQPLLHPLDPHSLRQTVSDVLQLLICRVVWHQKAVTVSWLQDKQRNRQEHKCLCWWSLCFKSEIWWINEKRSKLKHKDRRCKEKRLPEELKMHVVCFLALELYSPTHILPMMRHPAMDAWTTGMVSDSSPSNTLWSQKRQLVNYFSTNQSRFFTELLVHKKTFVSL